MQAQSRASSGNSSHPRLSEFPSQAPSRRTAYEFSSSSARAESSASMQTCSNPLDRQVQQDKGNQSKAMDQSQSKSSSSEPSRDALSTGADSLSSRFSSATSSSNEVNPQMANHWARRNPPTEGPATPDVREAIQARKQYGSEWSQAEADARKITPVFLTAENPSWDHKLQGNTKFGTDESATWLGKTLPDRQKGSNKMFELGEDHVSEYVLPVLKKMVKSDLWGHQIQDTVKKRAFGPVTEKLSSLTIGETIRTTTLLQLKLQVTILVAFRALSHSQHQRQDLRLTKQSLESKKNSGPSPVKPCKDTAVKLTRAASIDSRWSIPDKSQESSDFLTKISSQKHSSSTSHPISGYDRGSKANMVKQYIAPIISNSYKPRTQATQMPPRNRRNYFAHQSESAKSIERTTNWIESPTPYNPNARPRFLKPHQLRRQECEPQLISGSQLQIKTLTFDDLDRQNGVKKGPSKGAGRSHQEDNAPRCP